ncbi:Lrp/AsnC family transcriptional regulator [Kutzneria albida]|uniref:Lct39 n=1 Tax=Kutzneria albida DSM 43870 TaxID=1449976 RepID=W5WEU3_9PSEU|nr:AsnC family transcriptional regulator [Kutzneria albida]AHH96664.1 Lct39 [Kutzneria albida DSM 43870]
MEPLTLDALDRQLMHALQLDGRAPFARIAAVLAVSDQTVARRYHRLRSAGALRVLGLTAARRLGQVDWFLRVQCAPDAATTVAAALARREDTSWVSLTSGGTEITCVARGAQDTVLLSKLPRSPRILSVTAHCLLRSIAGHEAAWPGRTAALSADQVAALQWTGSSEVDVTLTEPDHAVLRVLAEDGRADHARLAKAGGCSESTVRRRLDQLRRGQVLYFDVETDSRLFGYHSESVLWLTVAPAQLATVARALAGHAEIAFAAATTGPSNVVAFAVCRDADALYTYLSERIGALPGVLQVETAPIVRSAKRAGPLLLPHPH